MPAIINFPSSENREKDLRSLQEAIPVAVAATVDEVGVKGLAAFFDGYRESVDLHRKAA
jgi:hypothetical protein